MQKLKETVKTFELLALVVSPKQELKKNPADSSLHSKFPPEWNALGGPMRKEWVAISNEARTTKNVDTVSIKPVQATQQCVACRSTFKLQLDFFPVSKYF